MRHIYAFLMILFSCAGLLATGSKQWPTVAPLRQRLVLKESGPRYVRTRVCGPKGNALYLFQAYLSAEEFFSKELEVQSGNPNGDLECRLTEIAEEKQGDWEPYILFNAVANERNDWSHRGIFWIEMMEGEPTDPLWGLNRAFVFRGMTFTIRVVSFELAGIGEIPYWAKKDRKRLKSVTLELEVIPNPKAKSAFDPRR